MFGDVAELTVCWSRADDALASRYEDFPQNVEAFSMRERRGAAQNRVPPIRGNERLSLFLPDLQDDLRNRPPPHSTTG